LLEAARVEHGDAVPEVERLFLFVRDENRGDAHPLDDLA